MIDGEDSSGVSSATGGSNKKRYYVEGSEDEEMPKTESEFLRHFF